MHGIQTPQYGPATTSGVKYIKRGKFVTVQTDALLLVPQFFLFFFIRPNRFPKLILEIYERKIFFSLFLVKNQAMFMLNCSCELQAASRVTWNIMSSLEINNFSRQFSLMMFKMISRHAKNSSIKRDRISTPRWMCFVCYFVYTVKSIKQQLEQFPIEHHPTHS